MPYFRLKAGSHSDGVGLESRHYNHKGPFNIIESEDDLAASDPRKFEPYNGPIPDYLKQGKKGVRKVGVPSEIPDHNKKDPMSLTPQEAMKRERRGVGIEEEEERQVEGEEEEEDNFDSMTVAELKDYAKKNRVDISGLTTRADIIERLRNPEDED